MSIAYSRNHVADRVGHYVDTTRSLSETTLRATIENIFGAHTRTIIVGGLVRDMARGGISSRHFDVDVVLDLDTIEVDRIGKLLRSSRNRFGGYGTTCNGWKIDFWALSNTWAHKAGHRRIHTSTDILDTIFFNVDAIAYDLHRNEVFMDDGYLSDLHQQILEIRLEPNPSIAGNLVRAVRRLRMWNYRSGHRLASFLVRYLDDAMLEHVIATENRMYGKSYAANYRSAEELLEDLTTYSLKNDEQLSLSF